MNLFNYLMAKKGHNTSVRNDLLAYLLGKKHGQILPSEYTQVDYIESTGTQYIDTNLIAENSIPIKCVCKLELTDLNFTQSIIGSSNSVTINNRCFVLDITANNRFEIGYKDGYNSSGSDYAAQLDTIYNIESYISNGLQYLKLNNNIIINASRTGTLNNPYNLYLFSRNISNSSDIYAKIKLYSMQLYSNDILVRNFIPCYRNSDNEVGLYDIVNNVFYTNQGTGEFLYS